MKLLTKGKQVKLTGTITQGTNKNGYVYVDITGSERKGAVSVEAKDVKRRIWGR